MGMVKTRLAASLGAEAALRFHQASLRLVIERLSSIPAQRFLYLAGCNPEEADTLLAAWPPAAHWQVRLQTGGHLGQRLKAAFQELWHPGARVVFLGSDAPSLPPSLVGEAFRRLDSVPVVLGPAEDGGYYLLGLNRPVEMVFSEIEWGTARVLEQTLERVRNLPTSLLPSWFDVDDEPALRRLLLDLSVADRLRELGAIDEGGLV
jgi:hypothetical protein